MRPKLLAMTFAVLAASCSRTLPPPSSTATTPPSAADAERIRAMVLESHQWSRATRGALQKLADCRAMSEREDSTHRKGEKFHIYVKGPRELMVAYQDGKPLGPGAVIVKRTFVPHKLDGGTVVSPVAEEEGALTAFFVMEKIAGANPGGGDWLYATTTPDGTVLRAGALADCMECHEKRRDQGFLYGLDYRWGTPPLR